jgi:hypothetical protein
MEPEFGVMLVWPMAAMEAQALGWSQIEPAHLLCAILKFAELDGADLDRLREANGNPGNLAQEQRDLRARLEEPWGITTPGVSTPLRRALRRRSDGQQRPNPGGMVHRSDAAREVFCVAQGMAEQAGRQRLGLADLACAILDKPDEWIRRGLDQHGILSAPQRAERDRAMERWGDVFVPLAPSGGVDDAGRKRILGDPAVRVLADTLAKPASRPCLLIHGADRTARDVLIDLLRRPGDKKPPKIIQVDSRVLLERLSRDVNILSAGFLDFLCDEANQKTVWFFDSLHRYLVGEPTPSAFRLRFIQWLQHTDGRFLFAIPESQYNRLAERHPDWQSTFQRIWIHSPSPCVGMEL